MAKRITLWDECEHLDRIATKRGPMVPPWFALRMLLIERARFWKFIKDGDLEAVGVSGHYFIAGKSIDALVKRLAEFQCPVVVPRWAGLYQDFRNVSAENGLLLPTALAADLLDISPNNVSVLVRKGHLFKLEVEAGVLFSLRSIRAYAEAKTASIGRVDRL